MSNQPLLSVIIISHNQCDLLRRCINSVLRQRTSFPKEVIVSDDRSTDGTREMLETEYANKIITTYCNTDEYNTHYTFERAGYNRLNGLKKANGKYIIHIDGDDLFIGDSIFQKQVDVLETHPECSMCVQNFRIANSDDIEHGEVALSDSVFKDNPILTVEEFIMQVKYVHNSACCMRRECLKDSLFIPLEGKSYDDVDITYRYLGNKNVALLSRSDFVYVQNPNSFCHTIKSIDWSIISHSELQCVRYVPHLTYPIIKRRYNSIWALAKMAWKRVPVTENLIDYFKNDDMFIYKVFDNKYNLINWLRINAIIIWLIPIRFMGVKNNISWKVLYKLAIK